MSTLIKLRRDTAANWASADPVLQLGEPGYDTTNNELRIGDGTTPWSELTPIAGGGAANIGNWVFDGNDATVDNDGYPHLYGGPDGGPEFTYLEEAGNTGSYSQTMYINGEDGFFVSLDYGNAQFAFNTNGTTKFPTLTVDLHNGGNQSGQVLQFGDAGQQAIITGPTPAANINAQRLIIQGQRGNGTGEGGDVYLWGGDAETNGGDIKIYAGDADNVSAGGGGYVNIAGGDGFNYGGDITLNGGYSANGYGGQISLNGGQGQTDGGLASINGGYGGTGQGGAVGIYGGGSGNGAGSYGNVTLGSASSEWKFDNTGTLTFPENSGDGWPIKEQRYGMGNIGAWLDGEWTIGEFSGNGVSGTVGIRIDPAIEGYTGITLPGSATSNTQPVQIYSTNGSGIGLYTGANNWLFGADGNLTLPSNTASINYANGDPFSGGPVNTGNVTFDDNVVIGTGDQYGGSGLYLAPGADSPGNLQYLRVRGGDYVTHIHLDTGNNVFFDQYFGDDNKYVKLEATGNIVISADDDVGNTAQWTFDTVGNITLPNNGWFQTASGSNANIGIHPNGTGTVVIKGGAGTLLNLTSDEINTVNRIEIDTFGNSAALGGSFIGRFARGNPVDGYQAVQSQDRLAQLGGVGYGDTGFSDSNRGRVTIDAADNWTDASQPTHVSIWTTPFASTTPVEMARFGSGQNFVLYAGNITVGNGRVTANLVTTVERTTSALPLAANTSPGTRGFVTDADTRTWGNLLVGGAGNAVPVWTDGTNWYVG